MGDDQITIAERIREEIHLFTPTERRAAHALLLNYPVAGLETVAEFGRRASVSAPTVLRFVARLGYQSYPDFQRALRDELDSQVQSPLKKRSYDGDIADGTGPLAAFHASLADNLASTFRHISKPEFETAVGLLGDRKRKVAVIGGRLTDVLARHLASHLSVVRPEVRHFDGQFSAWRDRLVDYGAKDVLVIFDFRRYQDDLLRLAELATRRNITVILFTDQWLSPVSRLARHVFSARIAVPSRWDSMTSMLGLTEALVAAITEANWTEASRRITAIDSMRE